MKKLTTALLTALLLLNLAACGEKEPDDTSSGYDDSLISELYSEEGEYTDTENNTLAYSYHVPRIMSETAVAAALQAFEDGLYRVFAGTVELEKLESPLTLAPDENLTFIRLTMLAGRMW